MAGAGFDDLRRANATTLVAEGVDVKTAQTRLGHADPRTTPSIYALGFYESGRRDSNPRPQRPERCYGQFGCQDTAPKVPLEREFSVRAVPAGDGIFRFVRARTRTAGLSIKR